MLSRHDTVVVGFIILCVLLCVSKDAYWTFQTFEFSVTDGTRRSELLRFSHLYFDGARAFQNVLDHPQPLRFPLSPTSIEFLPTGGEYSSYIHACIHILQKRNQTGTVGVFVSKRVTQTPGNFLRLAKFTFVADESHASNARCMDVAIRIERRQHRASTSSLSMMSAMESCDVVLNQWKLPTKNYWITPRTIDPNDVLAHKRVCVILSTVPDRGWYVYAVHEMT